MVSSTQSLLSKSNSIVNTSQTPLHYFYRTYQPVRRYKYHRVFFLVTFTWTACPIYRIAIQFESVHDTKTLFFQRKENRCHGIHVALSGSNLLRNKNLCLPMPRKLGRATAAVCLGSFLYVGSMRAFSVVWMFFDNRWYFVIVRRLFTNWDKIYSLYKT